LIQLNEKNLSLMRILRSMGFIAPLSLVFLGLLLMLLGLCPFNGLLMVLGVIWLLVRLHKRLLSPLALMQNALYHFGQGEPWQGIGNRDGVLHNMAQDINGMIEELGDLYDQMDNRVASQTRRLAEKTASLKILYEAANSINQAHNLDELLIRFLRVLKEMVGARSATVRLLTPAGEMRVVACIDNDNDLKREQELLPIRLCQCGVALTPGDILCEHDADSCSKAQGRTMYPPDEVEVVEVPMPYHQEQLGFYRLYVPRPGLGQREEELALLEAIGRHLGMAVAKHRSDTEAHRLLIVEERTALAHELHDSLAQTLASLRYQVRMLSEALDQEQACDLAKTEVQRIVNGLDEANGELRALLASFRAPLNDMNLMPALEQVADRFRNETEIPLYLQSECRQPQLGPGEVLQLLRIVQECLANIRKHAKAHTVRVLLRCTGSGEYVLLVEDDGVGFDMVARKGNPGEHIGLSILEERAQRIHGEVRVESEPGEGTRVELTFRTQGTAEGKRGSLLV
jgi:two-component system nitrate/nitrite sensor histidine kinase NarX